MNQYDSYIELVETCGGIRKAAKSIGVAYTTFHDRYVKALEVRYQARSVTLRHDNDSNEMRPYYIKTGTSKVKQVDILNELKQFDFNKVKPANASRYFDLVSERALLIPICDLHIGNQCFIAQNNDSDWNLEIVRKELPQALINLLNDTYDEICLAFNGDYLHFDSAVRAETPVSGHPLNSSGYFGDMVQTAQDLAVGAIDMCLNHTNRLILSVISGNHDEASMYWLSDYLKAYYRNEPKITFLQKKVQFTNWVFGNNTIYLFHGDKLKFKDAPVKLPSIFPDTWCNPNRYAVSGHYHHLQAKEDNGITNIMVNSLCPVDDYSARGVYMSRRCLTAMEFDKKKGIVNINFTIP
jgi:hypothetical protein